MRGGVADEKKRMLLLGQRLLMKIRLKFLRFGYITSGTVWPPLSRKLIEEIKSVDQFMDNGYGRS